MNSLNTFAYLMALALLTGCGDGGADGLLERECDPNELRFEPPGLFFVAGNEATTQVALLGNSAQEAFPPTSEERSVSFSFLPLENTLCVGCGVDRGFENIDATVVAKLEGDPETPEDDCVATLTVSCGIGSGGTQNSRRECALDGFGPPYIFLP